MSELDDNEDSIIYGRRQNRTPRRWFDEDDDSDGDADVAAFVERLRAGYHIQNGGKEIKIRYMEESHLRNSIKYGEGNGGEYWDAAIPLFKAELKRRCLS